MTDPAPPAGDQLEQRVAKLEKTAERLRRDQATTRRQLRELAKVVDQILPSVRTDLEQQTQQINRHVDERLSAQQQFVMDTLVGVARQWPAAAIVAATIVATVLANWILAAVHLPHIH